MLQEAFTQNSLLQLRMHGQTAVLDSSAMPEMSDKSTMYKELALLPQCGSGQPALQDPAAESTAGQTPH